MAVASFVFCAINADIPAPFVIGATSEEETISGANAATTASANKSQNWPSTAEFQILGLNELRDKINVKMGPAAGATGYVRRGRAAIGLDPDVAEYERERMAAGRALAVAIMGGLIVATVLTLLALPAMYAAWFRVEKPSKISG